MLFRFTNRSRLYRTVWRRAVQTRHKIIHPPGGSRPTWRSCRKATSRSVFIDALCRWCDLTLSISSDKSSKQQTNSKQTANNKLIPNKVPIDTMLHKSLSKWSKTNKTLKPCWSQLITTTLLDWGPHALHLGPLFVWRLNDINKEIKRLSRVRSAYHEKSRAERIY